MKINVLCKNMELTQAISEYVTGRVSDFEKLLTKIELQDEEIIGNFEVSKSTNHHKAGDVFHADCSVSVDGKQFYASSDKEDLYQAIDEVKERLYTAISKSRNRKQTLFKRGATSVKKMMKGLSKRNPFTSK